MHTYTPLLSFGQVQDKTRKKSLKIQIDGLKKYPHICYEISSSITKNAAKELNE
jgi:hypothetical protein